MLTSEMIKEKARAYGADLCGIAPIERFADLPIQRDPKSILPEAKTVLGFGFRVPKGLYYCMDKKTQYNNYTNLGVKYIDEELSEIFLLKMARIIENEGYDACVQRNVSNLKIKGDKTQNPELIDTYELVFAEPVAPGKAVPDVIMDFAHAARACGLGSVSQGVNSLGIGLGGAQEVVSPGQAGLFVDDLLIQGLGHVQAQHGGVAAVLGVEVVDGIHVEVAQLGVADLVIANGQGDGLLFPDAAVGDGIGNAHGNGDDQQHGHDGHKCGGNQFQFLGFLLSGQLLFSHLGSFLLFAELFLAGCTHVIISSR